MCPDRVGRELECVVPEGWFNSKNEIVRCSYGTPPKQESFRYVHPDLSDQWVRA